MNVIITLEMNEQDAKILQSLLGFVLVSSARQPSEAEHNFIKTTHAGLGEALLAIEENRPGPLSFFHF